MFTISPVVCVILWLVLKVGTLLTHCEGNWSAVLQDMLSHRWVPRWTPHAWARVVKEWEGRPCRNTAYRHWPFQSHGRTVGNRQQGSIHRESPTWRYARLGAYIPLVHRKDDCHCPCFVDYTVSLSRSCVELDSSLENMLGTDQKNTLFWEPPREHPRIKPMAYTKVSGVRVRIRVWVRMRVRFGSYEGSIQI